MGLADLETGELVDFESADLETGKFSTQPLHGEWADLESADFELADLETGELADFESADWGRLGFRRLVSQPIWKRRYGDPRELTNWVLHRHEVSPNFLSHASTAEDFVLEVKPLHIYFTFFNDSGVFLSFKRYRAMLIHHRAQLSLLLWLLTRTMSTMTLQCYLAFILVIPLSTLIFMSF